MFSNLGRRVSTPGHILGHARLPDIHAELEKLAVDPRRSQRIANFREQPIETNENHSVDGAEGEFLWRSSPQNVDLLPQRPNLCLKHYRDRIRSTTIHQ
jgi:hypothetical protein